MNTDIERDVQSLQATGVLPQAQPSFKAAPHKNHSIIACFALGILGSGFLVWFITTIIATSAAAGAGADPSRGPGYSPILAGLFAGFVAGFIGFIIPGLLVGGGLWLRESRLRVRETTAVPYRRYWQHRQQIEQALGARQMTPRDAAGALWQHRLAARSTEAPNHPQQPADAPPYPTSAPVQRTQAPTPAPVPGQPPQPAPRQVTGQWHGVEGEETVITAETQDIHMRSTAHGNSVCVHILRTGEGDLVRWMADSPHLDPGSIAILSAGVVTHSVEGNERCTDLSSVTVVSEVKSAADATRIIENGEA